MRHKRDNLRIVVSYLFTFLLCCPTNRVAATSRVTGALSSSDIGDSTGDHYLVFDDPDATYEIGFDQEYEVDFFLLGGGGGGADNRGGAGGSGAAIIFMNYRVEQGKTYTFDVGAKGSKGATGGDGGDSTITVDGINIFKARGGGGGSQCCGGAAGGTGGSSGSSGTHHGNNKAAQPSDPADDNIIPSSFNGTSTIQTAPTTDATLRYRVMGNAAGWSDLEYPSTHAILDSDGAGGIGAAGSPRVMDSQTSGYPGRGGDGAAETTVQNQIINFKNHFSSSSVACNGVEESNFDCYYGGGGHGSTTCDNFPGTNSPKSIRSLGGGGLSAILGTENGVTYQNRVNAIGRGSGGAGGQGVCGTGQSGDGGDGSDGLIMIRIKQYTPSGGGGLPATPDHSCAINTDALAGRNVSTFKVRSAASAASNASFAYFALKDAEGTTLHKEGKLGEGGACTSPAVTRSTPTDHQEHIDLSDADVYIFKSDESTAKTSHTLTLDENVVADILVVGGGGAGGGNVQGGGGGAGALLYDEGVSLSSGVYTINVGLGGSAGTAGAIQGNNGEDSGIEFNSVAMYLAKGGGGGGSPAPAVGGSGGGGATITGTGALLSSDNTFQSNGVSVLSNAYNTIGVFGHIGGNGGSVASNFGAGGGGGGAGGPGQDAVAQASFSPPTTVHSAGDGGPGKEIDITGCSVYYAGGGGGGYRNHGNKNGDLGNGGLGGGGDGMYQNVKVTPYDGIPGTGGGGGGIGGDDTALLAGKGGSGIVIVRVRKAGQCASSADGGTGSHCIETPLVDYSSTYQYIYQGCVPGNNLDGNSPYDMTPSECAEYCNQMTNCLSFEYGVDYGIAGSYLPNIGQCRPQTAANDDCNGDVNNIDLYVKPTR